MADMNYTAGEVTNFTIEFTLQHIARCEKVFHAARTNLKPEHFSKPGESVYKAVWSAILDYYARNMTMPTYQALSMRVMTAVEASPLPGLGNMVEISLQNADDLLRFMYSTDPGNELTPDEALETLREILLDRDAGDALRSAVLNAGGRHIHDLPKLLEKQQRRVEEITAIGRADDDDSTIPENWDSVLRPRWPTGVAFVDKIMEGGSEAGDCNVILGPTGGGKTTLSMQIACSCAHMQVTYEKPDSIIEPGLVVFIGYEDGRRMQQIRAGACAANVVKNRLQSARDNGGPLSTCGNLEPYEQAMYQGTPSTQERLGEQERLEEIKPWMNKYLALVDYHDHSKGGRGHVTEICQKLHALQQKRGLPIRTVIIDWAGEMVDNYLLATYGKIESGAKALELGGLVRRCKSEIAVPFNSTVWVSHQMAGRFTSSAPARRPHHSEANWCTSFADNAWYAFCLGTKDIEHSVCQFVATKTRHGESGAPVILKFTPFSKLDDVSDKFKPDLAGLRLLPKDDVDRIQEAPVVMPRRNRRRNEGANSDLDHEI